MRGTNVSWYRYNYHGSNSRAICAIPARYDAFSDNPFILDSVVTAGLYPNVAYRSPTLKHLITGAKLEPAYFHPSSINYDRLKDHFSTPWFIYNSMVKSSRVYLSETHAIGQYPLLLFGRDLAIEVCFLIICIQGTLPGFIFLLVYFHS